MIPFSPPRIDDKTIEEVKETLLSGWITTGPKTKLFEKHISSYCGHKRTICVSSATAGFELMMNWFGVGRGDEVIIPAYTYCAIANAVVHLGAKPVMVDVDDDFTISPEKIRESVTSKTKVIIPVDVGGYPADYKRIYDIINEKKIKEKFCPDNDVQKGLGRILVISDAAHSLGASIEGKKVGILTDITIFSFQATKNITTCEGGAVCINLPKPFDCDKIYKQIAIKSLHGQTKDAYSKTKGNSWRYDILEAGYKSNMTDLQAAMGLVELKRYESDMLPKRKYIFNKYYNALKDKKWAILPPADNSKNKSACNVFMLRVSGVNEQQRDEIIKRVYNDGASLNVHYIPLPLLSFYRELNYNIENFPKSYELYSNEISLPIYYDLTDGNVDFIINSLVRNIESVLGV